MTKTFQHKIEYIFIKALIATVNILPIRLGIRCGDLVGIIAFSIIRYRRKVALINLRKVFGNKYSQKEYKKIARRSYINMGRTLVEMAMFPSLVKTDLSQKIKVVNGNALREQFEAGKGVVLISGHFGSWEMMGAYLAQSGWPIDFLVGIQHNLKINDLMNKHRTIFGIGLIEIGVAARGVFTAIKNGRGVAMLSDQDAGSDGVIIEFLGIPSSTSKGPAAFALKTGAPVYYGAFVREGLDNHTLYVEGPITVEKTADKEDDIKRLTQAYSDQLAKYITKYPDHWLWTHRRWKYTCPEDYR